MTAKKTNQNKAYRYKAPPAPRLRGLRVPSRARSECASASTLGERIRPSLRRPKHHPNHPPRPTTLYPTDTLEPCTES